MSISEPIKLSPAFKDYLWGGTKLKSEYGKISNLEKVAESWELSTHKDGQSLIASGTDKGLKLSEYIEKYGKEILGSNAEKFSYFPILIKFIDAKDNLSIQVHPDDDYALKNEGEYGKTEMWYILDADEGASLYYGFNQEITKDEYSAKIKDNTILDVLNKVDVHKGDVFFIKSGTVHAIGKGIVICEIQQNSNTTYRVYDYDRRDKNGNPRDLHIEKAIEVSTLSPVSDEDSKKYPAELIPGGSMQLLAKCGYFTVYKYEADGDITIPIDTTSFKSIVVTDGCGKLTAGNNSHSIEFKKGESIFVPAQDGEITISGKCTIIVSYV